MLNFFTIKLLLLFLSHAAASIDVVKEFETNGLTNRANLFSIIPRGPIQIEYCNNESVEYGNEMHRREVLEPPIKVVWDAEPGALYTLVLVDPDARVGPFNPRLRQFNHWLIVNIQGTDLSTGDTLTTYAAPDPEPGTGYHRYTFLVYKQNARLDAADQSLSGLWKGENRKGIRMRQLARGNRLGNPVAGNFFETRSDMDMEACALDKDETTDNCKFLHTVCKWHIRKPEIYKKLTKIAQTLCPHHNYHC